jgi:hypothetical protein
VPALSALLACAVLKVLRDLGPLFGPVLFDELKHLPVFRFCPRPFYYQFLSTLPPEHRCWLLVMLDLSVGFVRSKATKRKTYLIVLGVRQTVVLHCIVIGVRQRPRHCKRGDNAHVGRRFRLPYRVGHSIATVLRVVVSGCHGVTRDQIGTAGLAHLEL